MSSNVVKYNQVVMLEEDKRIIDTNALMDEKLKKFKEMIKHAKTEEAIEGFAEGLDAKHVELLLSEEDETLHEEEAKELTETLRQEAYEEIEQLKQQALEEAQSMKQQIMEAAKEEGFQQGYADGSLKAKAQMEEQEQKILQKERELLNEYEKKTEQIEAVLVDTIAGIYEHIFQVKTEDFKESVLYLIQHTIHTAEGCRDFIVHVSKEDYSFVLEHKAQLIEKMPASVTVEVIEDAMVSGGGCMIETDSGILDCGIDTQLSELGKQLRILSYEK